MQTKNMSRHRKLREQQEREWNNLGQDQNRRDPRYRADRPDDRGPQRNISLEDLYAELEDF